MENSAVNLKRKEAELKHFCKATDRRVDTTRSQVHAIKNASGKIVGFDRSAAQRARNVAIKHHTDWLKSIGAESSELKVLDKYYDAKYNSSPAYKYLMDYRELVKRGEITPLLGFRTYYATQEQLKKGFTLYDESEKKGFIASSHFMEQFIKREFDKAGKRKFAVSEIKTILEYEPKYIDSRNGRMVLSNRKIHIVIENDIIVTLRLGRLTKQWVEI